MECETIDAFVKLVKEMRTAQKKAATSHLDSDLALKKKYESDVDKVIREREHKLFLEEVSGQGTLL